MAWCLGPRRDKWRRAQWRDCSLGQATSPNLPGAVIPRATVGVICWTCKSRVHFISAYAPPDTDPEAHDKTQIMFQGLHDYIAEAGGVPCATGEAWNFKRDQLEDRWDTVREAQLADTMGPTQRFGRNLEWCLASKRLPMRAIGTEILAGTDHVGVTLTLGMSGQGTLGQCVHSPTPIPTESLDGAGTDDW